MEIIDPITGNVVNVEGTPEQLDALRIVADLVELGRNKEVPDATQAALDTDIPPFEVVVNGLQAGLAVVGERFKRQEAFIPEVLLTARAMQSGMDVLKPLLATSGEKKMGVVVLGTVQGDLHDIGKKIVGIMLEGAGYEVHDVGVNASPQKFYDKIIEVNANIMGMSALLTTTMLMHGKTIEFLEEKGIRDKVICMSGGAPVTPEFAMRIKADAYAPDAAATVETAKKLLRSDWDGAFINGDQIKRDDAA